MAVTELETGAPGVLIVGRDAAFCARLSAQLRGLSRRLPIRRLAPVADAALARQSAAQSAVVLLDLGLPDAAGHALAREWADRQDGPAVILLLPSIDSQALADLLPAVDSLLPPLRAERLEQALQRALGLEGGRRLGPSAEVLLARGRDGEFPVPVAQVVYLRASGKSVSIRTAAAEFVTDQPLAALLRGFPGRFVQVHRSTLVARAAIAGASLVTPEASGGDADPYWELRLHGVPETIPVARRRWPDVRPWLPGGLAAARDGATLEAVPLRHCLPVPEAS
ncbi:LytTr DNA-binding domain protein [Pigmentiphaga humi]|uniref:LytTr DNA-binding domain protein n=1 Tax=Pigmentiphaga humi TaxID=2478468 RepID=A0A3P4B8V6_9BURK|nr:LytTR family DNA-binding domain-containing protein [Pigmentiphaga humi]VCU71585.1 LytTr DNA-binding domain protein [Pigmentiphaga humi]